MMMTTRTGRDIDSFAVNKSDLIDEFCRDSFSPRLGHCTMVQNRKNSTNGHLVIHFPTSSGMSAWANEPSEQYETSNWMSGPSELANKQASGPLLTSVFLVIQDSSGIGHWIALLLLLFLSPNLCMGVKSGNGERKESPLSAPKRRQAKSTKIDRTLATKDYSCDGPITGIGWRSQRQR